MPFITFSVTILGAFLKAIAQVVRIEIEASLKKTEIVSKFLTKCPRAIFYFFQNRVAGLLQPTTCFQVIYKKNNILESKTDQKHITHSISTFSL